MEITVGEIADFLGGTTTGERSSVIKGASTIEEGKPGTICFLSNMKYESFIYTSKATAILVDIDFVPGKAVQSNLIFVPNVYEALAKLLERFNVENSEIQRTISPTSTTESNVILGKNTGIGHYSVIGKESIIGDNVEIDSHVYIGKRCKIGNNTTLMPGVRVLDDCVVGDNVLIHSNTVIGSDGFGFAPTGDGSYVKIRQMGNVVIEDDVEIGSNCTIDRATFGSTIIRKGVKLDNLIQIAHNVEIGENTVIAAQTGIAGSTKIGEGCKIGGQVGIVGHITIANGTQIQAQSGVQSSIKKPNTRLFGSPALEYQNYLRSYAVFRNLPSFVEKWNKLEATSHLTEKNKKEGNS